jgi:hypothetical protein
LLGPDGFEDQAGDAGGVAVPRIDDMDAAHDIGQMHLVETHGDYVPQRPMEGDHLRDFPLDPLPIAGVAWQHQHEVAAAAQAFGETPHEVLAGNQIYGIEEGRHAQLAQFNPERLDPGLVGRGVWHEHVVRRLGGHERLLDRELRCHHLVMNPTARQAKNTTNRSIRSFLFTRRGRLFFWFFAFLASSFRPHSPAAETLQHVRRDPLHALVELRE